MANKNNRDYDKPIPQAKLKEALDKELALLGMSIQELMFEQLSRKGISFGGDSKASYSLRQLESVLEEMFGSDAALLILEKLHSILFSGQQDREADGHFSVFMI